MRLANLQEFRRMFYTPDSAPTASTLKRRIKAGQIPGGGFDGSTYVVNVDQFIVGMGGTLPERSKPVRTKVHRVIASPESLVEWKRYQDSFDHKDHGRKVSAAHSRKRKRRIAMATPLWVNMEAIREVYDRARKLTRQTGIPHSVDHEIPLQGRLVSGLHIHTNLRVLTSRENSRKHNLVQDR